MIIDTIASVIAIPDFIFGRMDSLMGYVKENRTIDNTLTDIIENAKNQVRKRSQYIKTIPVRNEWILLYVLSKVSDKEISPNFDKRDEILSCFNKNKGVLRELYDIIVNNKQFWEILHGALALHREQLIGREETEGKDRLAELDKVIAELRRLVISIEKESLESEKIRPYYPLDVELFVTENDRKKLYRNKNIINKIHQNLDYDQICLIQGSEGRGKTTLSRIIASDYYAQNFKVYFLEFKSGLDMDLIRRCLIELNKTKAKTLLVLEDVHAFNDLSGLVDMINRYIGNSNHNLYFLLNARPTESDYAAILARLGKKHNIYLRPHIIYCSGVVRHSCNDDKIIARSDLDDFINSRIYSNVKVTGANLRLLSIYCSEWNERNYDSILDIKESNIFDRFQQIYGLREAKTISKKTLLYLSCIYQFDAPLSETLLSDGEIDSLQPFVQKGLCTLFNHKYYLPHSVEAALLCKAICGEGRHVVKTTEMVKRYIDDILDSDNPRSYEYDFVVFFQGLINKKSEFGNILFSLTDLSGENSLALKLIENVNPRFAIGVFNSHNGHTEDEIRENYLNNIDRLKTTFLQMYMGYLSMVNISLSTHVHYMDMYKDIFETSEDYHRYLELPINSNKSSSLLNPKKDIIKLGSDYKILYNRYLKGEPYEPKSYSYYFNTTPNENYYCVTNKKISLYWNKKNPFDIHLLENGFYFKDVMWYKLQNFIYIIHVNNTDDQLCRRILEETINMILKHPVSFSHATSKDLNYFFWNLSIANKDIYIQLIDNKYVQKNIKKRLSSRKYSLDDLRLLSHFLSREWFPSCIDRIVTKTLDSIIETNEKDLSIFLGNLNNVNTDFYNQLMENKFIIDNIKKRIEYFSYREDNLYLFSRFYSQDWCREKLNKMTEDADESQKEVLLVWYKRVKEKIESNGKEIEEGSFLAYLHEKFDCPQDDKLDIDFECN